MSTINVSPREFQPKHEIVLLIHGTTSFSEYDRVPFPEEERETRDLRHHRWWQRDSRFWTSLDRYLHQVKSEIKLPPPGLLKLHQLGATRYAGRDAFVWSGANSEQDREEAAQRLHRLIVSLRQEGYGVHLIGHSHGGSIIRQMLLIDGRRPPRNQLDSIRSITTLGTPYLTFGPSPFRTKWFFGAFLVLLFAFFPAWAVKATIRQRSDLWTWRGFWDWHEWELAYEAVLITHSWLTYALLPVTIVIGALFLLWGSQGGRLQSLSASHLKRYRPKWLVVFSRWDEAINGLLAAQRFNLSITPRTHQSWSWIYDRWFAPAIDRFVNETLTVRAMGNNLANGATSLWVSRYPGPDAWKVLDLSQILEKEAPRKLSVDQAMKQSADRVAKEALTRLRNQLSEIAEGTQRKERQSNKTLEDLSQDVSDAQLMQTMVLNVLSTTNEELVHNHYFRSPKILAGLAEHLVKPMAVERQKNPDAEAPNLPWNYSKARWTIIALATALSLVSTLSLLREYWHWNDRDVVVASKDFDESQLMAGIFARRLEQHGYRAAGNYVTDYQTREIIDRATHGDVELYLEYTSNLYDTLRSPQEKSQGAGLDPFAEPLFPISGQPVPQDSFPAWFSSKQRDLASLRLLQPGEWLGYSSPYLMVMKREATPEADPDKNSVPSTSLYRVLCGAKVIVEANEDEIRRMKIRCPNLEIRQKISFDALEKWLDGQRTESQQNPPQPEDLPITYPPGKPLVKFGLSFELRMQMAAFRQKILSRLGDDGKPDSRVTSRTLEHRDIYHSLSLSESDRVDFVDGYSTDPELAGPDSPFVALMVEEKEYVGEIGLQYQAMPVAACENRFRRAGILNAVRGPIEITLFSAALKRIRGKSSLTSSNDPSGEARRKFIDQLLREPQFQPLVNPTGTGPSPDCCGEGTRSNRS